MTAHEKRLELLRRANVNAKACIREISSVVSLAQLIASAKPSDEIGHALGALMYHADQAMWALDLLAADDVLAAVHAPTERAAHFYFDADGSSPKLAGKS